MVKVQPMGESRQHGQTAYIADRRLPLQSAPVGGNSGFQSVLRRREECPVASMLESGKQIGIVVDVVNGAETDTLGTGRDGKYARKFSGGGVVSPDIVIQMHAGVLANEQGSHRF